LIQLRVGVAVREYQTNVGPAAYVLFVDKKPAGLIEAKRAEEGVHGSIHLWWKIVSAYVFRHFPCLIKQVS
jgi:hypothetical protein